MQAISFQRSMDQLEADLVSLSARRNATEYAFLELVREFEIRQGYRLWMLNSSAEWLNLKCGISPGTAPEKVRVAMALFDKPAWSAAFRDGLLSYSKARAMIRVIDQDEDELLSHALIRTASQVEAHCRQLRNAHRRESTADANHAYHARWLSCREESDGMVHISANLPQEAGMLVMTAIEKAAAVLEDGDAVAANADGYFAKQADALVELARAYLSGVREGKGSAGDHYRVLIHVDESALKDEGGKSDLPIETVRRITCDAGVVAAVSRPSPTIA